AVPFLESFLERLGKSEIDDPREIKARAFYIHRRGKLGASQNAELRTLLGADGVLAALTAIQSQERRVRSQRVGQIGEERRSFVIRMRYREQDASDHAGFLDRF